jgi:hypothetical protein
MHSGVLALTSPLTDVPLAEEHVETLQADESLRLFQVQLLQTQAL